MRLKEILPILWKYILDKLRVYPAKVAEESLSFTICSATRSSKNYILLRFDKLKI